MFCVFSIECCLPSYSDFHPEIRYSQDSAEIHQM
jgi:hypothetical protein